MKKEPKWNIPETAPKTRVILVNTGFPWPLVGIWDAECKKWAVANLNIECLNKKKESLNVWWETEYEKEILGWIEMPALLSIAKKT